MIREEMNMALCIVGVITFLEDKYVYSMIICLGNGQIINPQNAKLYSIGYI
jgi:hypothetical protein